MDSSEDKVTTGCPVDHKRTSTESCPVDHSARSTWMKSEGAPESSKATANSSTAEEMLGKVRAVSSIPRAEGVMYNGGEGGHGGDVSGSSNWVYPSEEMFFNAMKRKNWNPQANDMKAVVPIHNAVNERAWMEILKWEANTGASSCGGPKLVSFSGDSSKLTPRARINMLLGYQRPFDRHDWVVDRCGKRIEYVIDFYAGKGDPKNPGIPSFYLDVRPKLTPEGAWLRFRRFVGLT
ncbi:cytochrome c/c1 heme-lyase [Lipomyces kononenkoae]|uniref:Cytochrome c/c1 heme-lyase n=1 Tax=Lipomyces kononenkoae TaxID=34357 RepID=A0ACC3TA54_LIPKO